MHRMLRWNRHGVALLAVILLSVVPHPGASPAAQVPGPEAYALEAATDGPADEADVSEAGAYLCGFAMGRALQEGGGISLSTAVAICAHIIMFDL